MKSFGMNNRFSIKIINGHQTSVYDIEMNICILQLQHNNSVLIYVLASKSVWTVSMVVRMQSIVYLYNIGR